MPYKTTKIKLSVFSLFAFVMACLTMASTAPAQTTPNPAKEVALPAYRIIEMTGALDTGTTNPAPPITGYLPTASPSGAAMIIFPGGGYGKLAEHEGAGYAKRFVQDGIACFVVEYRLGSNGHRHPAMLEDALSAVRTVRRQAEKLGIEPNRIGVMGSSAGGHLAAHTVTAWSEYTSDTNLRPDFGVLCYPVITSQPPFTHKGSMRNLAGNEPSDELLGSLSCDKRVTQSTPPCFLWHATDDKAVPVENSMLFAQALQAYDVPFEMHIYPTGGHGQGLRQKQDWASLCAEWIQATQP